MAKYEIQIEQWDGKDVYILKDLGNGVNAEVLPSFGANLIGLSIRGKDGVMVEMMRRPPSYSELEASPNRYGQPVLMPPNRISDGRFTFNGREYNFPINDQTGKHHIHGLVKAIPWEVVKASVTSSEARLDVMVRSKDNPLIDRYMPQDFTLSLAFILKDGILTINALMENHSSEPIPFGLGFHPYFRAPLAGSGSQEQCFIKVPAKMRWELQECFPTGTMLPVDGIRDLRDWACLEGRRLDDDYFDLVPESGAYICGYEDRSAGIGLEFKSGLEYPQWVIFTGKETDRFVCLEPYTMMTNAFNLDLPEELKGRISLDAGEKFEGTMSLRPYLI